jgi:thiol-disulfide isomerase/thioredoxin
MRFALPAAADTVNPSSTVLPATWGDGGGLMVKRVVPALFGAVLVAAAIWIAVQHWGAGTPPWADGAGDAAVPPISGTVRNFTPTNPRRPAPIEPFYDADGRELTLQGFGGKVVLLNLWATWCAPCLKELPSLDRLQAELGGDRFQVVAVSVDRRGVEAVRPYFEKLKIEHLAIYVESKDRLAQALGLQILPSTIIMVRTASWPASWWAPPNGMRRRRSPCCGTTSIRPTGLPEIDHVSPPRAGGRLS